jgi:hypothetical protein
MAQSQSLSSPASGGTLRELIDDPERLAAVAGTGLIQDRRPDPVGQGNALVVPDARVDERLAGNPAIAEHGTVAYAGVPGSRLSANRSAVCARPTSSRGSGASSKSACCTTSLRRPRYASTSEQLNDQGSPDD